MRRRFGDGAARPFARPRPRDGVRSRNRSGFAAGSSMESAERLRAKFGIKLNEEMRKPLPRSVWDELSGEEPGFSPLDPDDK